MKRNKITFLISCMLLLAHLSFSQTDNFSVNQPQSKLSMIANARALLIDAFVENDKKRVQELHRRLCEDFDQGSYLTLYPYERILLFAWSDDFKSMLQYAKEIDSTYIADISVKIKPDFDNNFYHTLFYRVQREFDMILINLEHSSLTQEEKDFINIYLYYFLLTDENYDKAVFSINTNTRKFIEAYPDSEYIDLLESYEKKPSDWGWGLGLDLGYNVKNGDISKYFKNGAIVGVYIDITFKNTLATLGISGSYGSPRNDIINPDELVLPKGTNTTITNYYLSLGHRLFDDKRVILTPNIGIGSTSVSHGNEEAQKDNPDLKQFKYSYGLTTNVGIMADIKLGKIAKAPGQNFINPCYSAIRISYKFFYNHKNHAPEYYRGNFHTITVGYSFYGRVLKSVKYK